MAFFKATLRLACALFLLAAMPLQAQTKDQNTETLKLQLEQYLKAHPNTPRKVAATRDGRITIPKRVLEQIEYPFEKRYAMSGHGVIYDAEGRPVKMGLREGLRLQQQMLEVLAGPEQRFFRKNEKALALLAEIEAAKKEAKTMQERVFLNHILIRDYVLMLPRGRGDRFVWRSRYVLDLTEFVIVDVSLRWPGILDLLTQLEAERAPNAVEYRNQCDVSDVIIPRTFNVNDNIWTHQGDLSTNLLSPGQVAKVYTYASPNHSGGCVALPRGSGGAGSLAGLICQSATSGDACFWDNIDASTGLRVPWATETIKIDEILNATTLTENCTNCHHGNNVFLVAPDDPTWCRLLRGATSSDCAAMSGPNSSNFTLQVNAGVNPVAVPGTNPPLSHPSYTPLSGTPARPDWVNAAQPGCGASCHLGPTLGIPQPSMPPACGFDCNN